MKVCVPLTDFIHGALNAREGVPVEIADGAALDLERAGLVRIRLAPVQSNKEEVLGKAADDGTGQSSSASPVAPVLPTRTSSSSKSGGKKSPKKGR